MNIDREANTEEHKRTFDEQSNSVEENILVLLLEPICNSRATIALAE